MIDVRSQLARIRAEWQPKQQLRDLLHAAADLLFPPLCVSCEREIENPTDAIQLCGKCRREFIDLAPPCPFCGASLPAVVPHSDRCVHCRTNRFKFTTVIRLGHYEGALKPAILIAKKATNSALAIQLGSLLGQTRGEALSALAADVIVPVPAHWTRRSKHGHNSADMIAAELASQMRLPLAEYLIRRIRPTRPQSELVPRERFKNVRDAFAVRPHRDLEDAHVLLVDDVLTTGATANEAAKVLLKAKAQRISVAVLARATGVH